MRFELGKAHKWHVWPITNNFNYPEYVQKDETRVPGEVYIEIGEKKKKKS